MKTAIVHPSIQMHQRPPAGPVRQRGGVVLLAVLLTVVAVLPAPSARAATADPQAAALQRLRASSKKSVDARFVRGFPRSVVARVAVPGSNPAQQALSFVRNHAELYRQTDAKLGLGVRRVALLPGSAIRTVVLHQTYAGLPVHNGELVVYLKENRVFGTLGSLLTDDVALDTTPALGVKQAEKKARAAIGARKAAVLAPTALVVFDRGLISEDPADPRLAWRIMLAGKSPTRVFVDARSGEILDTTTFTEQAYAIDLESAENDAWSASGCYWFSDETEVGDEDGIDNDDYASDPDALNALAFSKGSYDFYLGFFGRDSYDNDGETMDVYIDALIPDEDGNVAPNAQYAGGCDLFEFSDGFWANDVMTHELTHAVIAHTSELDHPVPPGALDESYADILAAVHDGDWLMGEDLPGPPARSLSDPPMFNDDPDRWSTRYEGEEDFGGRHTNAGITNKAAFLLAAGGTHDATNVTVQAIGTARMGYLYGQVAGSLPSNADFFMARDATLVWADLLGYWPSEICSIRNAFGAVEIGLPDKDCNGTPDFPNDPDFDTVQDPNDNCPSVANPAQADLDDDGLGDACDEDIDGDGVIEELLGDNCPGVYNPDQADANHNGIGEMCDPLEDGDIDDDEIPDLLDNCPFDYNPYAPGTYTQPDVDGDGEGDACDPDRDGDGITDDVDNCGDTANAGQQNADGDLLGDACDDCPDDGDQGVAYGVITLPDGQTTTFPIQPDADGDGVPDACDANAERAHATVNGNPFSLAVAARPNGKRRTVTLVGAPGERVTLPLVLCEGACPSQPLPDERIDLIFRGLGRNVVATISDDRGRTLAHTRRTGGAQTLHLRPRGGRRYSVEFALGPDFTGKSKLTLVQNVVRDAAGLSVAAPPPLGPVAGPAR